MQHEVVMPSVSYIRYKLYNVEKNETSRKTIRFPVKKNVSVIYKSLNFLTDITGFGH